MSSLLMSVVSLPFVRTSIVGGALILLVLALRAVGGRHLPPAARSALWAIIGLQLTLAALPPLAVLPAGWAGAGWFGRLSRFGEMADPPTAAALVRQVPPGNDPATPNVRVTLGPVPIAVDNVAQVAFARPALSIPRIAYTIWVAGVLCVVAVRVGSLWRLRRAVGAMTRITDPRLLRLADEAADRMNVSTHVRLVMTDRLRSPAVFGIWRPVLLLPAGVVEMLADVQLRLLLAHEFAHVKRRDPLIVRLADALLAMHWFNPLVWLAARALREDQEAACDAAVLRERSVHADLTDPRQVYGRTLVHLLEQIATRRPHPGTLGASSHTFRRLKRRMDMIARFDAKRSMMGRCCGVATVATVGFAAITCAPLSARSKPTTSPASVHGPTRPDMVPTDARPSLSTDDQSGEIAGDDDYPPAVRAALARRLPEVRFNAVTLRQVVAGLAQEAQVPIELDENAFKAAGVDPATPITFSVRNLSLAKTLLSLSRVTGVPVGYCAVEQPEGLLVTTAEAAATATLVTRTYDIRDLLIQIPDSFSAGGSTTTQPRHGGEPDDAGDQRAKVVEQLIRLLTDTVAPDSWKVNGGVIGAIQELGGQLIVTQTRANQAQILALLKQIRGGRALQVNVTARFVECDEADVPAEAAALLAPSTQPAASGVAPAEAAFVPPARLNAIVQALARSDHSMKTLTAPRLTLFNGQHAYVQVTTQQAYISSFTMTRTAAGEQKYEPTVGQVDSGVIFDVQPTASADRRFITLSLRSTVTRLIGLTTEPFAGAAPETGLRIQRPNIDTQVLQSAVSVPDGGTVLLRSGPMPVEEEGGAVKPKVLLLLVTPKVIEPSEPPTTRP